MNKCDFLYIYTAHQCFFGGGSGSVSVVMIGDLFSDGLYWSLLVYTWSYWALLVFASLKSSQHVVWCQHVIYLQHSSLLSLFPWHVCWKKWRLERVDVGQEETSPLTRNTGSHADLKVHYWTTWLKEVTCRSWFISTSMKVFKEQVRFICSIFVKKNLKICLKASELSTFRGVLAGLSSQQSDCVTSGWRHFVHRKAMFPVWAQRTQRSESFLQLKPSSVTWLEACSFYSLLMCACSSSHYRYIKSFLLLHKQPLPSVSYTAVIEGRSVSRENSSLINSSLSKSFARKIPCRDVAVLLA